jgi:hypothetical protein
LESDAALAKRAFRNERLLEPLDLYNRFFTTFAGIFRELVDKLPEVTAEPVNAELIAELVDGRDAQKAFRYLTAPPISKEIWKRSPTPRSPHRGFAPIHRAPNAFATQ